MDKMTAAQKNAYLEAHMAVQQHMQQATILFNKQHQQQNIQRTDGQGNSNISNQQSHQSPPSLSSNQHYANTIKVMTGLYKFYEHLDSNVISIKIECLIF